MVGIARASVDDVVLLHNLSVGLGRPNGLPGNVTATESKRIAERLLAGKRAAASHGASDRAAQPLSGALTTYAELAQQLHSAAVSADKKLPGGFASDLAAADKRWKSTLQLIGRAAGVDLLANLPPLLMPQSLPTTIPPPPK